MKKSNAQKTSTCTEQDLMKTNKKIAIIGAGPAGALTAIFLAQTGIFDITIFDAKDPLSTLLPTGGGRCNLTYYEPDYRELAKYYPRGEKFLLSIFSKFNSLDTIQAFESMGISTFIQEDSRVFPTSESSKEVAKILKYLLSKYKINIIKENVDELLFENEMFVVSTKSLKHKYFHKTVIATGGKGSGFELAKGLGHKIIDLKAALTPLKLKDERFYTLSGLTLEDVTVTATHKNKIVSSVRGNLLFTHKALSGPVIYKTSSQCAYTDFDKNNPLTLKINISNLNEEEINAYIAKSIELHPKKNLRNVFSKLAPKSLVELIFQINNINPEKEITHLSKNEKKVIVKNLTELEVEAIGKIPGEEIVTAGGVCLNQINNKTMESKIQKGLYFAGEVINVDGYTGGFNLQNCWSTAFVCADALKQNP